MREEPILDDTELCSEHGKKELAHRVNMCAMLYRHQPTDYERCVSEACTLVSKFEDWRQRPPY
jgi:hypothetical protein